MSIKVEVIIYADEEEKFSEATTAIYTSRKGYTQKELDIAKHIKGNVDQLFKTEFKTKQFTVIDNEEKNNVH